MAISILGQVLGAAEGVLHLTDNNANEQKHQASPQQLVVEAVTHEAQQQVTAVLDHLAGQGSLAAALAAHVPDLGPLSADDEELVTVLRLYQHFKADLADDGKIDVAARIQEVATALHLGDLAKGWAGGLVDKLLGRK